MAPRFLRALTVPSFAIPGREEWTVIINKTAKQWGRLQYDSKDDVLARQGRPQSP